MRLVYWIGLFGVAHLLAACGDDMRHWPSRSFEPAQWRATRADMRYIYIRSLIGGKHILDLSRSEVVTLLGPPSFDDAANGYMTYVIKAGEGEIQLLDIRFVAHGGRHHVARVFVRAD